MLHLKWTLLSFPKKVLLWTFGSHLRGLSQQTYVSEARKCDCCGHILFYQVTAQMKECNLWTFLGPPIFNTASTFSTIAWIILGVIKWPRKSDSSTAQAHRSRLHFKPLSFKKWRIISTIFSNVLWKFCLTNTHSCQCKHQRKVRQKSSLSMIERYLNRLWSPPSGAVCIGTCCKV